jgi:quinol monooxygenase YgiN
MYARSTTIHGDPRQIDAAVVYTRDKVMPALMGMDGYVGISMLADRGTGRCVISSSWSDRDAMRRNTDSVKGMRARATDILRGPAEVHEWRIAVLHRLHEAPDGACTRVIWTRHAPARIDHAIDAFGVSIVPRISGLPGFCSVSTLVDHDAGRAATAVTYASRAAMDDAAEQASALREEFTRQTGGQVDEVATFELALAHLRVPETV